jgi:hypothetical protein
MLQEHRTDSRGSEPRLQFFQGIANLILPVPDDPDLLRPVGQGADDGLHVEHVPEKGAAL